MELVISGSKYALDGHMAQGTGEALAAYYYDLDLLPSSAERHDATAPDGRLVQIKAAQGIHNQAIRGEQGYLIVGNMVDARNLVNSCCDDRLYMRAR